MTRSSIAIRAGKDSPGPTCVSSPASSQSGGEPNGLVQPLRIMHVFDRLHIGGTEKAVMKVVKGLDPGLFEHCICALRGADAATDEWARLRGHR